MPAISTKISLSSFTNGKLPFVVDHISISEAFDRHHTFELTATLALKSGLSLEDTEKILGECITIEFKEKDTVRHKFIGITDNLVLFQQGDSRMVRIEGYSPTILLDSAPVFRAFLEKPIKQVVENILQKYKGKTFANANIKATQKVDFSVQPQETDYQYLCRLADRFESNFFYDGEQLHFCPLKNTGAQTVTLAMHKDLHHFRASVNLSPIKFSVKGYNHLTDKKEKVNYDLQKGENSLLKSAFNKSQIYPPAEISVNYVTKNKEELKAVAMQLATQQTNGMVSISGGSDVLTIKPGSILAIKGGKNAVPGITKEDKFRVTQVVHSFSQSGGSYSNSFSAIPANNNLPVNMPGAQNKICAPLDAEVTDTADPDHLGRVKVKFLADEEQSNSPWLRVLTTFTSASGHFFMPEVGEKVIVFFEDFNPEKSAFVMGSYFTKDKNANSWQDSNNRKKGISTGDISLFFDENEGKLTLKAKSILLQTDEGISIEGGKEITQKATNIKSEADQDNIVKGGKGVKVKGGRIDLN